MAPPVAVERHQIATAVQGMPGLRLLVLYGSRARGDSSAQSDWDFGYIADDSMDGTGLLTTLVERLGSDRVDLVDLSRASGLLRFRAARDSRLIFESSPGAFDAFRLAAVGFWCDVEPVLRRGYDDVLAGLGAPTT